MTTLKADANLKTLLEQMDEITNVVDDEGRLLGVITPKTQAEFLLRNANSLFDLDELEKRKQEKGGSSLEEIKELWRSLEKSQ